MIKEKKFCEEQYHKLIGMRNSFQEMKFTISSIETENINIDSANYLNDIIGNLDNAIIEIRNFVNYIEKNS